MTRIVWTLLCGTLTLAGCAKPADEVRLREHLADMEQALEQRDPDGLLRHVSEDFVGPRGMSKSELSRYARLMLMRQQNVGITTGPMRVVLFDGRATVDFNALLSGSDRVFPERVRTIQVKTTWQRDGSDWQLIVAEWSGEP